MKKKGKGAKHDYAMDSTLISFEQYYEQDCTAEQVMFDRTFDDMSLLQEEGGLSELLRDKSVIAP